MGGGFRLHILIFGTELDGVLVVTVFMHITSSHNVAGGRIGDLRVALECGEGSTGQDGDFRIHISAAVPGLEHPVIEDLASRRRGGRAGGNGGVVLIEGSIRRRVGAAIGIIEDTNAVSTYKNRAPLGVKINFLRNPETIHIFVFRRAVAPLIHGVGKVSFLIICSSAYNLAARCKRSGASRIPIPAIELISCPYTSWYTDRPAMRNTEVHFLVVGAPIQGGIRPGIGMEEDAVLDLTPLCVDRETFGHGGESKGLAALVIDIPSLKHEPIIGGRVIIRATFIVGGQVRRIMNTLNFFELSTAGIPLYWVIVTIHIDAVIV